jgi:hypothetical protein
VRPEFASRIRTIPVTPFVVVYRPSEDGKVVDVLRFVDGRRDLGTISFASWASTPSLVGVSASDASEQDTAEWGMPQLKNDPFFAQLKADIQEGVDAADRGETIPAEEVWRELDAIIDEAERNQQRPQ